MALAAEEAVAQQRRTANAMALQFRHSVIRASARRVASNATTTVLTSADRRAVAWLRQARQMYLGLNAARKPSISTGMGDEHAPPALASSTAVMAKGEGAWVETDPEDRWKRVRLGSS